MSYRKETFLNYKPSDDVSTLNYLEDLSGYDDIKSLFHEILNNGIHGFCYSLYEEGQGPGVKINEEQIHKRMKILQPHTSWVRSFSCTEGNEYIPKVAKEHGLKTLVGAWLGSDEEKNEEEIENLIKLAKEGHVDIAAVGNEVLYRGDLLESELIAYLKRVKEALPDTPIGYVDAYYEFVQRPQICELSDVILCNCYPYWEGTHFDDSFQHMRQMYHQAKGAANGKPVVITETGWPSYGEPMGGAQPNKMNAIKYFINTALWSEDEDIDIFYFSSFDEAWKAGDEGEVGAYWGIWDSNGKLKY